MNDNKDSLNSTMLTGNGYARSKNSDPMSQILSAYELESRGEITEARAIYQQIIEEDVDGTYAAIASKAIAAMPETQDGSDILILPKAQAFLEPEPQKKKQDLQPAKTIPKQKSSSLSWFYNLSVGRKQLFALIASEFLSLSLVGFGAFLIGRSLQDQLFKQAQSE
ncbi:MAG: hypothetical protein LH649_07950, partial [Pseudanabaena sp. CAN_BIN31]|nr:hypothetical protein [Pseudanabaena sp. CAN_BIN31]